MSEESMYYPLIIGDDEEFQVHILLEPVETEKEARDISANFIGSLYLKLVEHDPRFFLNNELVPKDRIEVKKLKPESASRLGPPLDPSEEKETILNALINSDPRYTLSEEDYQELIDWENFLKSRYDSETRFSIIASGCKKR